ncbi:hypothetical protein AKJ46_00695 [candidate division MSBL1 archaeon SCGC-AAA833K04]|uniref:HTH cro/C1-type domain-containing protein n=1 Tax=candidate division MSBL1 archaeon SCGC-AAA833K04 TaxID=1698258 RepID=A0A133VS09_9EURY|nr:hypothetical protein AKJ46_00695 [candidate division MSBL1 archaeon SCGC-AAA833K04]
MSVHKRYRFDGLSEYVSRRARVKLVDVITSKDVTVGEIARIVGVSSRSVRRWLDPGEVHPCNRNLDKLLDLAFEVAPVESSTILTSEVAEFSRLVGERHLMGR